MANKHTLGPLTFSRARKPDNTGGYDYCIVDENNKIIAETFAHVGRHDQGDFVLRPAEANARLFCSAPDLLAALKRLSTDDGCGNHCPPGCAMCQATAAIRKAEGRDA